MSKLSFRARALDANKSLPVYHADELPDLSDYNAINRAVPEMPTGMEKEEETEHHLQRAMAAQQLYGEANQLVIPTPDFKTSVSDYSDVYKTKRTVPRNYIRMHGFLMDADYPEYDLDDEDVTFCTSQEALTQVHLENMIETLEKGLGQQSQNLSLAEAQALLQGDDDNLVLTVFDYWQAKRARSKIPLMATVKQEKRDGSSSTDYYVAFRRRTEKMQTRKNRKNDEASYERMCKLRRDLERSCQLIALITEREQKKKDMIESMKKIFCLRYKMRDWNCSTYNSVREQLFRPAVAAAASLPPHPAQVQSGQMIHVYNQQVLQQQQQMGYPGFSVSGMAGGRNPGTSAPMHQLPVASLGETSALAGADANVSLPWSQQPAADGNDPRQGKQKDRHSSKRKHKKKHHTQQQQQPQQPQPPVDNVAILPEEGASEEDHMPAAHAENTEEDSGGPFAFRRRLNVQYCMPRATLQNGFPFEDSYPTLPTNKRYRLYLTSMGRSGPFLGMSQQRIGRGGRHRLDRGAWPFGGSSGLHHSLQHGHIDVGDVNLQNSSAPYYQLDSPPPAKRVAYAFPPLASSAPCHRLAAAASGGAAPLAMHAFQSFAHFPVTPVSSDEEEESLSTRPPRRAPRDAEEEEDDDDGGIDEVDAWDTHEFGEVVTCVRLSSSIPPDVVHRPIEADSGLESDGVSPLSDTQASRSSDSRYSVSGGKSSPKSSPPYLNEDGEDEGMLVQTSSNAPPAADLSNKFSSSHGGTAHISSATAQQMGSSQQQAQQPATDIFGVISHSSSSNWRSPNSASPAPTSAPSPDGALGRQRVNSTLSGRRHSNNQSPIPNVLRVL